MSNCFRASPFLLLYPGYFVYHWGALSGWIPFYVGGYINEASAAICFVVIILFFLRGLAIRKVDLNWTPLELWFFAFMAWFAAVVIFHATMVTAPDVSKNYLAAWIQMFATYLALRWFPIGRFGRTLLALFILLSFTVLWAAYADLLQLTLASRDETHASTYQGLARAYLVTAVFALVLVKRKALRWPGYIVAISVLFFIGARSEIIGAGLLFVVKETLTTRRPMMMALVVGLFSLVLGIVFMSAIDTVDQMFPGNRFLLLLVTGSADGSITERATYLNAAWAAVLESPLAGDFGHYARLFSPGAYAHNWISAWVDLGTVGVLFYVSILLMAATQAVAIHRYAVRNCHAHAIPYSALSLGWVVTIIVFALFVKHFSDPGLALLVGFVAALKASITGKKIRLRSTLPESCQLVVAK